MAKCLVFCFLFGLELTGRSVFISGAVLPAAKRRTVIVTGANRGIGLAAVKSLALTDEWNIVMACRSVEKAESARKLIKNGESIQILELDLADLGSVKKFAANWGNKPLHVLACNAGKVISNIHQCCIASVGSTFTPHCSSV